jgi:hypothetical protein
VTQAAQRVPIETDAVETPAALQQALDPKWLTGALAGVSGGAKVASVEMAELIKTMASKARIVVRFEGKPDAPLHLCLKAFMDDDAIAASGGATTLREADFYTKIAPHISMRVPGCISVVADRKKQQCILLMPDMVEAGAHFCSALEPFTLDQAAETLDQIARLHAGSRLLATNPWIPNRLQSIADTEMFPAAKIQPLMYDARRGNLPERTLDAALLLRGMRALAERNAPLPQTLGHGDCHAGNVYWMSDGPGFTDWQLIHRGSWALDVAYHICAILTVDVAEREERRLLKHYIDVARAHGGEALDPERAWEEYRAAQIYGFYHWAITARQPPPITNEAFQRLGAGVTRHETYKLLGL